jgi:hypothetical protein
MGIEVTSKQVGDKVYRNIDIKDLDYGKTATIELTFDEALSGEGKFGTWYVYNAKILDNGEGKDLGEVSFFAPTHLHRDLKGYSANARLKISPVEKKTQKGHRYKGFEVTGEGASPEPVVSDEDIQTIKTTLQDANIPLSDEVKIREILTGLGFNKEETVQEILTKLGD